MSSYSALKAALTIAPGGKCAQRGLLVAMRGKRLSREAALRIGAIVLVVAATIAFLPGLLSPPEPPPLPEDVGLGATGAEGVVAEAEPREARERRPKVKPDRSPERKRDPKNDARGGEDRETKHRGEARDEDPAPAPASPAPPPQPAVPAYVPPVPAPVPPAAPPPGEFGP